MRAWLISDNHDSLVGMRLAGIEGVVVRDATEIRDEILRTLQRQDIGILLVTEKISEKVPDLVQQLREQGDLPLLLEIPDRHGTSRESDFLTRYVRDAIGVKMG